MACMNSLTTRIAHRITDLNICTLRREQMTEKRGKKKIIGEKQREQKEEKRNMNFFSATEADLMVETFLCAPAGDICI